MLGELAHSPKACTADSAAMETAFIVCGEEQNPLLMPNSAYFILSPRVSCFLPMWSRFNINVNAIAPGAFSSEMMDGMLERMGDIAKFFPRKRICDPAQLDSTLLFLVSPSSDAVTGTCIKVDDGQGSR